MAEEKGTGFSKLYTRKGDGGITCQYNGTRTPKSALKVEAVGNLDAAQSYIGVVISTLPQSLSCLKDPLLKIERKFYRLQCDVAAGSELIGEKDTEELEKAIDGYMGQVEPLHDFILPIGCPSAAKLHFARTLVRKAERSCVAYNQTGSEPIREEDMAFVNRLSDCLFAMARFANKEEGVEEVIAKEEE
ncbi:MAG: cob(I)yrinic acid a,c-diamide adenosyltransferase [Aeriscardovia sp.]|nr:cob(I)yrinic acid a,c-diamide adenosyltransferase [Aeriscardovia sp.]